MLSERVKNMEEAVVQALEQKGRLEAASREREAEVRALKAELAAERERRLAGESSAREAADRAAAEAAAERESLRVLEAEMVAKVGEVAREGEALAEGLQAEVAAAHARAEELEERLLSLELELEEERDTSKSIREDADARVDEERRLAAEAKAADAAEIEGLKAKLEAAEAKAATDAKEARRAVEELEEQLKATVKADIEAIEALEAENVAIRRSMYAIHEKSAEAVDTISGLVMNIRMEEEEEQLVAERRTDAENEATPEKLDRLQDMREKLVRMKAIFREIIENHSRMLDSDGVSGGQRDRAEERATDWATGRSGADPSPARSQASQVSPAASLIFSPPGVEGADVPRADGNAAPGVSRAVPPSASPLGAAKTPPMPPPGVTPVRVTSPRLTPARLAPPDTTANPLYILSGRAPPPAMSTQLFSMSPAMMDLTAELEILARENEELRRESDAKSMQLEAATRELEEVAEMQAPIAELVRTLGKHLGAEGEAGAGRTYEEDILADLVNAVPAE